MKTVTTILILSLLLMSCDGKGKTVIETKSEIIKQDNIINSEVKKSRPTINLIYETESFKLYGDTTINKEKISYASIKFEPYIGFNDYNVNIIDHKKYADLNLKSNIEANNYRTRLREGYQADKANFAGHYTFVRFGCGSPCQGSYVIDRKTGKIYDSPSAALGYDFQVNSRMLIVNPPDSSGFYDDCFYCKPIIYIFNEQSKKFEERKQKRE